jgi:hypothetical protein
VPERLPQEPQLPILVKPDHSRNRVPSSSVSVKVNVLRIGAQFMSRLATAWHLATHTPRGLIRPLGAHGFLNWLPSPIYLHLVYWMETGHRLNLHDPQTYNEKLQWLKLYWHNPLAARCSDKHEARNYVQERGCARLLIEQYGMFERADDIDWSNLPDRFVLKCSHGSNAVIICKDKDALDKAAATQQIGTWMRRNYYPVHREWVYRDLPRRIVCEKYVEDNSGQLLDYKLFCFDGDPKLIQVDFDRQTSHTRNFYNIDWVPQAFGLRFPTAYHRVIPAPANLEDMLNVARVLASGFPHVRVDLYNVDGAIYFGEMTFFHGGGVERFTDQAWNLKLGTWLRLPPKMRRVRW